MDVFYIFTSAWNKNHQNVHLKLIFCHVLDWFNLREPSDLTCLMRIALTYGILNKNFQEIKLFTCHCSFITLAQKTTTRLQMVRFLETFRRALSWIKTEVLFLYMFRIELLFIFSFITCHSRILQCVEFKNFCSFAVCSVLLFFHNLCPDYSWIPLELSLLRLFSVVCLRLYILTEKVSLSKKWKSSPLFQNGQTCRLFEPEFVFFFFFNKKSCKLL